MRSIVLIFILVGTAVFARGEDWPKSFIPCDGSESPDGQFGILIPSADSDEINSDSDSQINYLANLSDHHVLGRIQNANLYENETHTSLFTDWNVDSSICVVGYDTRYGTYSLSVLVLAPDRKSFRQLDLGKKIQTDLDTVIVRQSGDSDTGGEANCFLRLGKDSKIRFRVLATTNPQGVETEKSWCAVFQGTFDYATGKWLVSDTRPVDAETYPKLATAYEDRTNPAITYDADEVLGDVYAAIQFILPAAKFKEVKASQDAWLKKLGRTKSSEAKTAMTEARIKDLKDLLW